MHTTPVSLLVGLRSPVQCSQSWEKLVRLYTPLLYMWARCSYRLGEEAAESLVSDLFAKKWRKLQEFDRQRHGSFRRYLWTTMRYVFLESRAASSAHTGEFVAGVADKKNDVDAMIDAEYRAYLIQRALQLLRQDFPKVWEAAWECMVLQEPIAKAAQKFNTTPGALYTAVCRIRSRLKLELEGLLD